MNALTVFDFLIFDMQKARAIESQCYVVAAAQVGQHNEKRQSYGHSVGKQELVLLFNSREEEIDISIDFTTHSC